MALQPIDVARELREVVIRLLHQSCLQNYLHDAARDGEGWDVGEVGVWVVSGGDGPVLRVVEGCVSHEDD